MALLYKHICENIEQGSPLSDLVQVVPSLSERRVKYLLKRLKDEEKIFRRDLDDGLAGFLLRQRLKTEMSRVSKGNIRTWEKLGF